jgi:FimV-like protein
MGGKILKITVKMIINPSMLKKYLFFATFLFLKGLIVSSMAIASNEVLRINAIEGQDQTRVVLSLKERPLYSLNAIDETHIRLTLHDTLKAAALEKNIPEGTSFTIIEVQNPVGIKIGVNLQKPFLKIDSSWLEDKKLLYIDISVSNGQEVTAEPSQNKTTLQDIRFGFIDKGTRMVMKLDNSPSWDIDFSSPAGLLMHLTGVSDSLKKNKFGPVKRLKEVNVLKAKKDKGTDISLALESSLTHMSIFRMIKEGRLVLDILDEPGVISGNAFASDNKTSPAATASKEDRSQAKQVIEDKGNYLRMKISKDEPPSVASSIDNMPVSETEIKTASTLSGAPETSEADAGSPVKIEPKLDDTLPMSSEMKTTIDGLDPEEAFLYGRIKQAMDIRDYEKGIMLTNQFLSELPNSSLVEDIMFMKGDFYYCLWKNGDNEVSGNIVSSYQKAIDRFPESELVPSGYIKMAQAQVLKGEEYLALGYLGLVLNLKKDSGLIPFAHLTRGKIFLRINQPEKAVADFRVILEKYKRSGYAGEANFWIANYYHSVGQYEEAEKKLEEVLESDPEIYVEYPEYLFLRAKNYLYLNDYEHAREYLFKAVNIGRQQENADMLLTRIGDTYHNQENEKEAEKFYRMVVEYYPDTEGASIAKLRIAGYSSDTSILDDLSKLETNESISELALLEKGYQLYDKNQYATAVDTIKPLIVKTVQTETRKSARRLFDQAAEKELTRLYKEGKYKDMTDFYTSIKDLLADNIKPDTMLSVALAFNRLQLSDRAISAFQSVKLNNLSLQSRGDYYLGFSDSYLNNGDRPAARSLLEKAKNYDLEPADKQRVSRSLALLYIQDKMLNDAYTLCQSIISGDKLLPEGEIAETYILTARILNLQKRYAEAEAIINSTPGMPDKMKSDLLRSAYMELGKAYYNTGDYPGAVKSYENGFDLGYGTDNEDYWNLRFNLAQSYISAGDERKARLLLSEISEGGDSILQQRAQVQLGSMDLEQQLQRLPLSKN